MFKFRLILLTFLLLVVACVPTEPAADSVSVETIRPTATSVPSTPALSGIDELINEFMAAGATVVNNGRTEQGLFPGDDIDLWHLSINNVRVNVFEFSDIAARQAMSDRILPDGYSFNSPDGGFITWDGEGYPHFWAKDALIVDYWGMDTADADLISSVLGQPFADGSRPYRPEASSGQIAGTAEYGISFHYDPYLAASISAEMTMGQMPTGADDFTYDVMPQHITFTFADTYAADWTLYHQTVNIPNQPQILIFPLAAFRAMNSLAQPQIDTLDDILRDRPDLPNGTLPHLPLPNGQQDLQAQMAYLTFQNGAGIRYLTQFNQEPRQINNQEIYYTFQGITADHAYYIAAFFPVQSELLPADNNIADYDAFASNMPTYLAETTDTLNALPSSAFQPDLTLLDTLIQTLLVEPTVELNPEMSQDLFCTHIARPALIVSTPDSHLISNPITGEQCPLALPRTFTNFSFANGTYAYGYSYNSITNQIQVQQLAADGTTRELDFTSPEEGDQLYGFILSEDGRQLIWSTTTPAAEGSLGSLWQADLDGQNKVQLVADWPQTNYILTPVRGDGEVVYFSLQPDGIGGTWEGFTGRYGSLYRVTAGSEPELLFDCGGNGILCLGTLSPDGTVLAYTDGRDKSLHLIQADGTPIITIATEGDYSGYPIFMPNGDLVYYTAVLSPNSDGFPIAQPGTLYYLAAPYTEPAQEIVTGNGIMYPVAAYDEQHLILNYNDELGQWGHAMLNLNDGTVAPLQPWPGAYFVALVTAD